MAAAIPVPGSPGRMFIPSANAVVQQDQNYEGSFYDTVELTTFADGTTKQVFKDQQNKHLSKTNLTQARRIPSHATLKLQRIGVHVRQLAGSSRPSPEDVIAVYEMGTLVFSLGKTNLLAEGCLLHFQSGLGVTGLSTANDFSALTLGVASQAAAPRLLKEADVDSNIDLNCQIQMGNNDYCGVDTAEPTIVGNVGGSAHIEVLVDIHGIINRPLGS